jgi:hypothetical protein
MSPYDNWDDYDDVSIRRRGGRGRHSGTVTVLGVISVVHGSLVLLGGMCMVLVGAAAGIGAQAAQQQGAPGSLIALIAGLIFVLAFGLLLYGSGMIVGGIGLLNRSNWGRVLTLVTGSFGFLFALLSLVGVLNSLTSADANPEDRAGGVVICLVLFILQAVYGLWCYLVLLNSRFAEEFQ